MQRSLKLARLGIGTTAPNPMVGAVLVHEGRILAEGWHKTPGGGHAEVECLRAYGSAVVPDGAVMFVTLEPCGHHGRTPPCADLLIERGVKHVVVAHLDPFPEVAGSGVARLREAGIRVDVGLCEQEARWTNRRFLSSLSQARPYVVLKWAASADGFLDRHPRNDRGVQRIGCPATDLLVHEWRSEEQAIMVGSTTVLHDDPRLNVRHVAGRHPLRVVLDRGQHVPVASHVFQDGGTTLLFTAVRRGDIAVEQHIIGTDEAPLAAVLEALHQRGIRSVMVEGGARLLGHFISSGLWDEARIIHGSVRFGRGTPAPRFTAPVVRSFTVGVDRVDLSINPASPAHKAGPPHSAWPW